MKKSKKVLSIFSVALVMVFSAAILAMHPIAENFTAGSIKSSNFGVSTNNDTATVNLSDGCVEISKAETEGYINVGMATNTETGYNCIPNNYVVKIVQTSEETANTIKVADGCGQINLIFDGLNINSGENNAVYIGKDNNVAIHMKGDCQISAKHNAIFSDSALLIEGCENTLQLKGEDAGLAIWWELILRDVNLISNGGDYGIFIPLSEITTFGKAHVEAHGGKCDIYDMHVFGV